MAWCHGYASPRRSYGWCNNMSWYHGDQPCTCTSEAISSSGRWVPIKPHVEHLLHMSLGKHRIPKSWEAAECRLYRMSMYAIDHDQSQSLVIVINHCHMIDHPETFTSHNGNHWLGPLSLAHAYWPADNSLFIPESPGCWCDQEPLVTNPYSNRLLSTMKQPCPTNQPFLTTTRYHQPLSTINHHFIIIDGCCWSLYPLWVSMIDVPWLTRSHHNQFY